VRELQRARPRSSSASSGPAYAWRRPPQLFPLFPSQGEAWRAVWGDVVNAVAEVHAGLAAVRNAQRGTGAVPASAHGGSLVGVRLKKTPTPRKGSDAPGDAKLGKPERAILSVLAQYEGAGAKKLALLTGYAWSGGFRNALSTLRTAGYIQGGNQEDMQITDEGVRALGAYDPLPTGQDLQRYWLEHRVFGKAEKAALGVLLEVYPESLPGPELAKRSGYEWSGGFRNALSALRTAGVAVGSNTQGVTASAELFE
jgi:hypothetical protein